MDCLSTGKARRAGVGSRYKKGRNTFAQAQGFQKTRRWVRELLGQNNPDLVREKGTISVPEEGKRSRHKKEIFLPGTACNGKGKRKFNSQTGDTEKAASRRGHPTQPTLVEVESYKMRQKKRCVTETDRPELGGCRYQR